MPVTGRAVLTERVGLSSSTVLVHQDSLPIMNIEGHRRFVLARFVFGHNIAMRFTKALTRMVNNLICL
jgi:hypothetical protein